MNEPKSNREKILFYLGNTGSRGFKRLIDLNKLSEYVGVSLNELKLTCRKLKEENKINYDKIKKDAAIMRLKPKYPEGSM